MRSTRSPRGSRAGSTSSASTSATIPRRSPGSSATTGWDVPVGIDRDGAVSNLYRVGVCPTIFLAYPGGILYEEKIRPGNYDAAELSELVGGLLKATRERAEQVR